MKVVLAGFPRVGKTTVFQSLTGLADSTTARGGAARGVIRVPDPRVDKLSEIYRPKKTTYATVSFVDVQPPEGASDERVQNAQVKRLLEVCKGSSGQRFGLVLVGVEAAHHDDRHLRATLADLFQQIEGVKGIPDLVKGLAYPCYVQLQ